MKLAKEIALDLKRRGSSIGKPALITLTIDELTLESIIAAKLEPVRDVLEKIARGTLGCPDSVLGQGKEALHHWMWSKSQEVARKALAMLSEDERR